MLSHTHFRILDAYFENVQTLSFENDQAIRARRPHSHIQNFMQICISCTRVYVCLCVLCAQQRVLYRDHRLHAIRKWRGVKSFRFRFIRRCNVYLHSTIINLYRRIFFFPFLSCLQILIIIYGNCAHFCRCKCIASIA